MTEQNPDLNGGDGNSLIHTHKLVSGTSEMLHYGIELAKTTTLPKEIIFKAEILADELVKGKKVGEIIFGMK